MPLFNFRLKPLEEIIQDWEAIGFDVPQYLSGWFWLSYGWYWLETEHGDIPTNHPDFNAAFNLPPDPSPYLDYQVARFLQDMLEITPDVLEPLPEPFAGWVVQGTWEKWQESVTQWWRQLPHNSTKQSYWDDWCNVNGWWLSRYLDMGYLAAAPDLCFWRVEERIYISWDTRNRRVQGHLCWVEAKERQPISLIQWQAEWQDFLDRLDAAMRERLVEVEALGVLAPEQIVSLHTQHEKNFEPFENWKSTDWPQVLASIQKIEEWSGVTLD